MRQGHWLISLDNSQNSPNLGYLATPNKQSSYLYTPPFDTWSAVSVTSFDMNGINNNPEELRGLSAPNVKCFGSLAEVNDLQTVTPQPSNLQILVQRPVTTGIIIGILYYGYYLWANRVPVEDVAYSYDAVVNRKELYRVITASLGKLKPNLKFYFFIRAYQFKCRFPAHYDLMHIGFNLMGMWQLGTLEPIYGSAVFAYLNADLVILTMAISTGMYYYMMTYGGQPQIAFQLGVGWSCVLFAWMVLCVSYTLLS